MPSLRKNSLSRPLAFSALVAAAALAGCASSDRLARISPWKSEKTADNGRTPLSDDRVNLFPFYYGAAGTNAILWPLIDWDDRGFAFRPVYNREDQNASVFFPLSGWDDRSGWALNTVWNKNGVLFLPLAGVWHGVAFAGPAFSADETHYGFVPLFGRYGDTWQAANVVVTNHPDKASTIGVYPFYYDSAEYTWIMELYADHRTPEGVTRRSLFGLAYHEHESADGSKGDLWMLPGWYSSHRGAEHSTISLLHSEGRDDRGSWFNLHPLWWSSESADTSHSLLLPVWYSEKDKHGDSTLTPLWSYGSGEGRSWFNIHPFWWSSTEGDKAAVRCVAPFWYERTGKSGSTTFTPLASWGSDKTGEADFVNVLGPVWHWSDDGTDVYRHALWPLFGTHREAVGPGESIVTPTLVALESSDAYSGFRFTPIVSVQKSEGGVNMRRWLPHLADFRSGKDGSEWYAFPLAYGESKRDGGSALRVTPLFSVCENTAEPGWWSWAHLWRSYEKGDASAWSVTPFVGGGATKDSTHAHVSPFYRHDTKDGETTALRVWPFVAHGTDLGLAEKLCAWSHSVSKNRESEAVFGMLWRRSTETGKAPAPDPEGVVHDYLASNVTTTTPFTDGFSYVKKIAATSPDKQPAGVAGSGFSVNPLWIPLYTESEEGDARSWSLLFGLGGGEHQAGKGRDSVLRYLYDREETEDGVRMNCFPFVQNDTLKDREKFSFLWRVFDRETDRKTGEVKGHICFIPY